MILARKLLAKAPPPPPPPAPSLDMSQATNSQYQAIPIP